MELEKRRFSRIPVEIRVEQSLQTPARTKDISNGGLCLVTENVLENGKVMVMEFSLPKIYDPVRAIGNVCWCKQVGEFSYETGVEFWEVFGYGKSGINTFITSVIEV